MKKKEEIYQRLLNIDPNNKLIAINEFPNIINECYDYFSALGETENLNNWQILHIAQAIGAYAIGWFHLCKVNLKLAFETQISQDPSNLEKIKEIGEIAKNDISKLIKQLPKWKENLKNNIHLL